MLYLRAIGDQGTASTISDISRKLCCRADPGSIPAEITRLSKLGRLDLGSNGLTGECWHVGRGRKSDSTHDKCSKIGISGGMELSRTDTPSRTSMYHFTIFDVSDESCTVVLTQA